MNKKLLVLLPVLALLGQGCELPGPMTDTNQPTPTAPVAAQPSPKVGPKPTEKAVCATETPQVYYVTKTLFSAAELSQIERDIVAPIKAHYDDETYGRAASIMLKKEGTDLIVEIIVDQTWTTDAGYEGVLLRRMKDGSYEGWTPTDPGPGYEG
ncbi:hypothetical protein M0Q28_02850 [Patescibacteria group bacterium]|jgi:hypothetical protein|nr:hypothetical protein [Patescibacteria group bacterium]